MTDQDFERIAQMLARLEERIDARFERVEARLTNVETFKSEIISEFNRSLDLQTEELFHRIGLLRDGVADVVERVEGVNQRIDLLSEKVEDNSLELLAHCRDLKVHKRAEEYVVKEDEAGFGEIPPECDAEEAELRKRREETRKKYDAVTEEINAYCAEKGVELPKNDGEQVIRQIRLESAKHRVEQELKKRREEGKKPE